MAAVATNPPQAPAEPILKLDSLSHIDIASLSQSELHALSLCSSSAFDLRRTDDIVVPKIDRSIFNESAGSRRQTYSRPRRSQSSSSSSSSLSAAAATVHRRRVPGLHPNAPPVLADDPERFENRSIIDHLKHFISQDPKFDYVELSPPSMPPTELGANPAGGRGFGEMEDGRRRAEMIAASLGGERKRKRGRKPKLKVQLQMQNVVVPEPGGRGGLEMGNRNGVAVDFSALGNADDPYGEELRRRTVGLEGEEALLGFLRELDGQWGSRRKKRKIVDASEFGDALPMGWKILLGLKRKEGRAWIYCRRYISPTGQQFVSCRDVSSYLQSISGVSTQESNGKKSEDIQEYRQITENNAGLIFKDADQRQDLNSNSAVPTPTSNEQEKEVALLGMENLAEVQIHDLFECHKCSTTFDEKDAYLQHLLSFHQRTTRRYRLGSSVGDGVIIKDGKYECQFCHKVFLERRRYNGHVGIHVRNYVRRAEEPATPTPEKKIESPTRDDLPSRISKMDALIEIAQNSMLETSVGPDNGSKGRSDPDKSLAIPSPEFPVSNSDRELNMESSLSEQELEDSMIDQYHLDQQDNENMVTDGSMEKTDDASDLKEKQDDDTVKSFMEEDSLAFKSDEIDKSATEQERVSECDRPTSSSHIICNVENETKINDVGGTLDHPKPVEVNTTKINELEIDLDSTIHGPTNYIAAESIQQYSEGKEISLENSDSAMSISQPIPCFPSSNATSDKEEQIFHVEQRQGRITGFEELRLEEMEPFKYDFGNGQESASLREVPIDLEGTTEMEDAFGTSVHFESEEMMLNIAGRDQLTTACVWCGVEFNHDALDSEMQADSVGFICPTCKVKISGELNVLDNGSPVNPHPI
ncbi:TFIIH C1-like domain containing protein [Trema orientale]|uniref:TFIIH C1-like domain containing protein n=1 Tax=Trema orientale TaxID=63057 RepID=A0A2P5E8P6_TREOI|nr:TFIIH C1-like domain containing protein [Trema orientale]